MPKTAFFGMLGVLFPDMAFLGNRGINPLLRLILRIEDSRQDRYERKEEEKHLLAPPPLLRFLRSFAAICPLSISWRLLCFPSLPIPSPHFSQNSSRANGGRVLVGVSCRFGGEAGSTPCKVPNPGISAPEPSFRSAVEDWRLVRHVDRGPGSAS